MKKFTEEESDNQKSSSRYFSLSGDFLSSLFEKHSIDNNSSIKELSQIGGIQGLSNSLKSDLNEGLNPINVMDFEERKLSYGQNMSIMKPEKSFCTMMSEAFEDTLLRILAGFGIVSLILGIIREGFETGWIDGFTILLAVIIVVAVTSVNNYMKEKQFQKLFKQADKKLVNVKRKGQILTIQSEDLLVGDLMQVNIGDILSVDGILIEGSDLKLDESPITGESELIMKYPLKGNRFSEENKERNKNCFLISGSKVMDGGGFVLICAVGKFSQLGKLKLALQEDEEPTPLQVKLEGLAEDIGIIGLVSALLTIGALLIHLIVKIVMGEIGIFEYETLDFMINAFLLGVTIVVAAVPEGLPLAVTIALAYSINKMRDENNFVKHLSGIFIFLFIFKLKACETMGGANNICSDKTGTLTQNNMQVTNIFMSEQFFNNEKLPPKDSYLELLCQSICINSTSNPKKNSEGVFETIGSQTECALLAFADKLGFDYNNFRKPDKILKLVSFSSERKKMMTLYQVSDKKYMLFVKGASERVLTLCNFILGVNSTRKAITSVVRNEVTENVIKAFAKNSLRTISLAYREFDYNPIKLSDEELEKDLTLIAVAGIMDPLRPEITEAINKCHEAGITVRMVTGDNVETAVAIAKKAGILRANYELNDVTYEVLEGEKFFKLCGGLVDYVKKNGKTEKKIKNLDIFKTIANELRVLARSSPVDKQVLVIGLKELQNVVAVTGDGTNDAIALKKANVGFAMNKAGTDVARDAADIILIDDNFNSIVTACKWGRNIFDSVRKFIQFQLTINVVALITAFTGSVVLTTSPLSPLQLLWINLIMDTFAALALSTEPPDNSLLKRKPYSKDEYMITTEMFISVIGMAIYQLIVLLVILFLGPTIFDIPSSADAKNYSHLNYIHFTIFFHTFVLMQVFNAINCRKLLHTERNVFKNFCNNPMFFIIEFLIIITQILLVTFGGRYLKLSSLTIEQHLICFGFGAGTILANFVIKIIPRREVIGFIHGFSERGMGKRDLDGSLPSLLRKRSSSRMVIRNNSSIRG